MAYDSYEDRDMDLDRGAELYDEDMYDSTDTATFGETLEGSAGSERTEDELAADDAIAEDAATENGADARLEDSFNETLSENPHIDEQLEDQQLGSAAESDYAQPDSDRA